MRPRRRSVGVSAPPLTGDVTAPTATTRGSGYREAKQRNQDRLFTKHKAQIGRWKERSWLGNSPLLERPPTYRMQYVCIVMTCRWFPNLHRTIFHPGLEAVEPLQHPTGNHVRRSFSDKSVQMAELHERTDMVGSDVTCHVCIDGPGMTMIRGDPVHD